MMWRWIRMIWPARNRRGPSRDAIAATERAEESRAEAVKQRRESLRLRNAAAEAEAAMRSHNAANHYARWLQEVMRGQR